MDKEKRKKIHNLVDQIIDLVDEEVIFIFKDEKTSTKEFYEKVKKSINNKALTN